MSSWKSWVAAEQGVRLLKSGVDGRATFLIHPAEQGGSLTRGRTPISGPGLTPLKDSIRVLNGFGRSLESILPKLKHGYLVEDPARHSSWPRATPRPFFLRRRASAFTTPR